MPYDPLDRVKAFEEEAAEASAKQAAKAQAWRRAQVAQLEKDGWTDAAARAKAQLAEEAKPTKDEKPVKAAEKTKAAKEDKG
jgi:hypothetical protein